jgi:very-short-patch-repair endonuclease
MPSTTGDPISWLPPSRVRLAIAGSVPGFLQGLRQSFAQTALKRRLVSVIYEHLPSLEPLIDRLLSDLAQVALALWPDWYGEAVPLARLASSVVVPDEQFSRAATQAGPLRQDVSLPWLRGAKDLCRAGRFPLLGDLSRAVQAAQLALAIEPRDLLIAMAVTGERHAEGCLLGLARASEWFVRATGARVLVIVPEALGGSRELDGINFDPLSQPTLPPAARTESQTVGVWPIIGRPHPYSPGEQLLARKLAEDETLGGLFQFNVHVRTRFESIFLVDLLWAEGRVVVEVDGYEHHSDRLAFSYDRRRDYELILSDYLVLRLPHDEVIQDVEIAIDKIRDLVEFRRSKGGLKS